MLNKVLIIEDDPQLRLSIEQVLELENIEPISTASFTQARRSIRSNFRGVILSDIQMPDHDGFDVLSFAQARDPDLPVVLLTGHSDVPTAIRAIRDGAYDYLEKPCDPTRLVDCLRRALDHRNLVLENRQMKKHLQDQSETQATHDLNQQLEDKERQIISNALNAADGKVNIAAQNLGLARNTLYDRMSKLGIIAKSFRR